MKSDYAIYTGVGAPPNVTAIPSSTQQRDRLMTLSKTQNRILWTVRILLAAAFAAAGAAKLTGEPMMIEVFEQVVAMGEDQALAQAATDLEQVFAEGVEALQIERNRSPG